MQRERLEGWMVKQIENADLAKETVLQLPSRATAVRSTSPRYTNSTETATSTSPRRSLQFGSTSPRRTQFSTLSSESDRSSTSSKSGGGSATSPTGSGFSPQAPQSPRQRTPGRKNSISPSAITSPKSLEPDASTGLEKQWRAHFRDPRQTFVEHSGRVDRTKVLKWSCDHHSQHEQQPNESHLDLDLGNESASPLFLWGLPREHIVDYIRQSVLPSSWSMYVGQRACFASS